MSREIESVIKYYVFKNDVRFLDSGFDKLERAIFFAMDNNCDEVEETIWSSRESYNNYEPAMEFKIVWKNK